MRDNYAPYRSRAERNIAWIERHLRVPEGKHVGKPFILLPHQRADLIKIFDNPHGTRQAIISYARKNAKTAFAAVLVLLFLVGPEARPNGQLYSAARSKEQASVVFNLALQMLQMSPHLLAYIVVREHKKELFCPGMGTRYKALASDAKRLMGLSPVLIVHDELGQVSGPDDLLYDALETACAAQENPLSVIISTQAPLDGDLLSMLIDDAKQGLDPSTVLCLYTCPTDEERKLAGLEPLNEYGEEALKLANPAYGIIQSAKELLSQAAAAQRMPSRRSSYKNLLLNQRVDTNSPFIETATWRGLAELDIAKRQAIMSKPADYMGLDLADIHDLCGVGLLWESEDSLYAHGHAFVPKEGLAERSKQDKTPYDQWVAAGHMTAIEGESMDYDLLALQVIALIDKFKPKQVGFDRWNWRHFERALKTACTKLKRNSATLLSKFVPVGMGSATMTPALRDMEGACDPLTGTLRHSNNPVLNMAIANCRVKGVTEKRLLVKKNKRARIDPAIALAVCFAVRGSGTAKTPTKFAAI